jgi:tetratricopeptide (TPR) repeat protein
MQSYGIIWRVWPDDHAAFRANWTRCDRPLSSLFMPGTTVSCIATRIPSTHLTLGTLYTHRFSHSPNLTPLKRMKAGESAALLLEYLKQADKENLKRLGKALGGHPLSMELAARRIKKEAGRDDLKTTLARCILDYEHGIPLGVPFADLKLEHGDEKDDNLTKSLYHSYETLGDDAKRRFRALGILAYDEAFDVPLLTALWRSENHEKTSEYCDELRLLSLLESVPNRAGWYRQHPLLRSYARALLDDLEIQRTLSDYAEHITRIVENTPHFNVLEWFILDPYVPHIQQIGTLLPLLSSANDNQIRIGNFIRSISKFIIHPTFLTPTAPSFYSDRREWLELGIKSCQLLGDLKTEAYLWDSVAQCFKDHEKANECLDNAILIYQKLGDKLGEAFAWQHKFGKTMQEKREYLQKALDMFLQYGGDSQTIALTRMSLASLQGQGQTTLIVPPNTDGKTEAEKYEIYGNFFFTLNDLRQAIDFYQKSAKKYAEENNIYKQFVLLHKQAVAWLYGKNDGQYHHWFNEAILLIAKLKDDEKAQSLDEISQGLQIQLPKIRALNDKIREGLYLYGIGMTFREFGQETKALEYLRQCEEIFEGNIAHQGRYENIVNNMLYLFLSSGKWVEGIEFFEGKIAKSPANPQILAQSNYYISIFYERQKKLREAINFTVAALKHTAVADRSYLLSRYKQLIVHLMAQNTVEIKLASAPWYDEIQNWHALFTQYGPDWVNEAAFIGALLGILDDKPITIADENPYSGLMKQVLQVIDQYNSDSP